ncbi:MAG: PD40 domain-containing protein [Syntrophaceae bacterium]|nr:PD40 domain-containing protein [Syntrophaceae bacterium]
MKITKQKVNGRLDPFAFLRATARICVRKIWEGGGMRRLQQGVNEKKKVSICFLILLFAIIKIWFQEDIVMAADKTSHCSRHDIEWSVVFGPDSDKILLRHRCIGADENAKESDYSWAIYEISQNRITDFKELNTATKYQFKYHPAFSRDGKLITFVSGQDDHRNIFVMNADGKNVRQLTHDYNERPQRISEKLITMIFNEMPSFSPDEQRILYVKSASRRTKPIYYTDPMYPSRWDIYEVNIKTGKEHKLTNYGFFGITQPAYLSDGKRFIFSVPTVPPDQTDSGIDVRTWWEYADKYGLNNIFIMDGKNNNLKPAFKNGSNSSEPQIAWNDTIIFKSNINEIDGLRKHGTQYYDLFMNKNGKTKRIFNKQLTLGSNSHAISPDGKRILIKGVRPVIYNLDGTKMIEIKIPWVKLEKNLKNEK